MTGDAIRLHAIVALGSLALTSTAAAAPRTFVSASGNDLADCSRATPCRYFDRALQVTDSGGEVIALTSGAYEPFTIGRAVVISAPQGIHASIRSSGPTDARNGITVNAGASDEVVIRGLSIDTSAAVSNGSGGSGISYLSAAVLFVEDVSLAGTSAGYVKAGIVAEGTTSARRLVVRNVVERGYMHGLAVGLLCCSTRPDSFEIVVENSQFNDNAGAGIYLEIKGGSKAVVRGSVLSRNGSDSFGGGVWIVRGDLANPGGRVQLEDNVVSHNNYHGIHVAGGDIGQPTVALTGNTVVFNQTGISVGGGGTLVFSKLDNTVRENSVNTSGPITPFAGL